MKTLALIFIHIFCAAILLVQACSKNPNEQLKGTWKTADGSTKLKITSNKFIEDEGNAAEAEDYFVKDGVIYTSYQGNQPYTQFVIKNLDDNHLTLLYPDSVEVAFVK